MSPEPAGVATTASAPESLYWTAPEFGAVVKLSAKSIYRLPKNDPTFPCVWIGGALRIPKDRVMRWLRDREQGARRLHVVTSDGEARPA